MNIQITSRKFKAKDSLKEFIDKEIKSLAKYYDEIMDVNVILSFTHLKDSIKTAEIVINIPGGVVSATESSDDFNKSVGNAIAKLQRQLVKLKTKKASKR